MNEKSKWIWLGCGSDIDQYGEFYDSFTYFGGNAKLRISADSNYAVYLNGSLVDSGQYPDFPHYKIYDEIDLTEHITHGTNHLAIIVWYYGKSNMSYYVGSAALRYEVEVGGNILCVSDESTKSRQSIAYKSGYKKTITFQLGFSFLYDLTKEDDWMLGKLEGFEKSSTVAQELPLFPRPVDKFVIGTPAESECIKSDDTHFLYDLGRENVGYLFCKLHSETEQKIIIAYGEHIVDGGVRRLVGGRDFSVELNLKAGENEYLNPFRRLGLRYLEVFAEAPLKIECMIVCPTDYPLTRTGKAPEDSLRRQIYDVSVRTLELCMHDHYEDTPWREQGLYAMDSRNQILCGYYAFGEYKFPRANLLLMSKDNRADNLLSICVPNNDNLTIPSFSLHYFTEVYEYTVYSGDKTLIEEIYPKLVGIIDVFINQLDNDARLMNLTAPCYWNFYEWVDGLSGSKPEEPYDAALNFLFASALQTMQKITDMLGIDEDYLSIADRVIAAANENFFDESAGLYVNSRTDRRYSELVNAFAVLCGAATGERAERIAEKLAASGGMTPATLSMVCFKYDAMLLVDRDKYKNTILTEIDRKYKIMLDAGATTFWETEKGEADFDNAGSLCHGWSSLPIYYYSTLL